MQPEMVRQTVEIVKLKGPTKVQPGGAAFPGRPAKELLLRPSHEQHSPLQPRPGPGRRLVFLGAACTVARRSLVMILIGVEVMLNAAGIALVAASLRWQQLDGQALVLFIMCVAAAEVAVGLALIVYSSGAPAAWMPTATIL